MGDASRRIDLAGSGMMFLSAALFGYFGFFTGWIHQSAATGQTLVFVVIFEWTLKCASIGFLTSAVLTFVQPVAGNAVYAVTGLLTGASLLVVAVLDLVDTQHAVMSPFLILIIGAWELFSGVGAVRSLARRPRDRSNPYAYPGGS